MMKQGQPFHNFVSQLTKMNSIKNLFFSLFSLVLVLGSFSSSAQDSLQYADESHFKNIRQLTFGGDNAEAYFSFDGKWLVFQKTFAKEGIPCDQIYIGKIPTKPSEKFEPKLISTGKGRTTCGAFLKDNKHIVFASTHLSNAECPPVPDRSKYGNKYIWPLYSSYDIFLSDLNGKIVKQLTDLMARPCCLHQPVMATSICIPWNLNLAILKG
jgi:Tol biopolymer transport system component